jgi:hypothetical protein
MERLKLATLGLGLFSSLVLFSTISCAQSSPKTIIVQASSDSGANGKQELELKGLKTTSSDAVGVRVFLDPGPDGKLDANSTSYLGSIYFSHQKDPNSKNKEGNFVLPLRKRVAGATRVVMYPISGTGSTVLASVDVREARIRSADNSAFQ